MTTITGIDPRRGRAVDVLVSDGRIVEVRESAVATELFVATGLIDLQVNGFGGHDLNEAELRPETVLHVAETVLQTGVTTFLPTLITQSEERLLASLRAIREALERFPLVRRMVAGVHMEGPFLSPEEGYRGAHLQEHVRPPDLHEVARWQRACGDLIRLITLSPHWDDVGSVIAELRRRGIQVALGHTHADAAQVHAAAEAGATLSTHLGNGIAATLARHPNAIWAQLADDRLSSTFIADGHHLDRDTLRAMLRSKGETRSILISDAVALAGMPRGSMTPLWEDGLSLARRAGLAWKGRPTWRVRRAAWRMAWDGCWRQPM